MIYERRHLSKQTAATLKRSTCRMLPMLQKEKKKKESTSPHLILRIAVEILFYNLAERMHSTFMTLDAGTNQSTSSWLCERFPKMWRYQARQLVSGVIILDNKEWAAITVLEFDQLGLDTFDISSVSTFKCTSAYQLEPVFTFYIFWIQSCNSRNRHHVTRRMLAERKRREGKGKGAEH